MRRLIAFAGMLLLAVPLVLTGCSDYDDSKLWKDLNDLKSRIEALEEEVGKMNSEISTMRKIVDESVTVVKVEETPDGYLIRFSDNTSAEIKHGTPGAPGSDGTHAPVIGVKKDADDVYYWTVTTNGVTEWLMADGAKMRVTGESVTPVIAVDADGYWSISYDSGQTFARILDDTGEPVSAVTKDSSIGPLFTGVTYDENNAYFELGNGSVITVPIRSNFYMLIRKAPEVSTFVWGETKSYEVEAVGVQKSVVTKPDEWKVSYADGVLTITAPTEEHKECADLSGDVSIIYFSSNGQSDAVTMGVVVEPDYTGQTVGTDFTVDITEITDKSVKMDVTPQNNSGYWYVGYGLKEEIDAKGTGYLLNGASGYLSMLGFYAAMGYLDNYAFKGAKSNFSLAMGLKPGVEYYAVVFGFEANAASYSSTLTTEVLTVPFKTKQPVVINTVYRINVSDVSWSGAKYVCVPSDDLGYFHGFVKKSEFDGYADDAAFMKSRIDIYADAYRDELYIDRTMTWDDLTAKGMQTVVAPYYDADEGISEMPLIEDTEYYVYAFSCTDGNASSPLSKAAFKTGKFMPSEDCSFEIATAVERQDVTVSITPSDKNTTYLCSITFWQDYDLFEDDLQFAYDDLLWAKRWAASQGVAISELLTKGNATVVWEDLYAASRYYVCVYGCSEDGSITTRPVISTVVTKGTVDEFGAKRPARNARNGGKVFFRR
jgi:hypothetical protein